MLADVGDILQNVLPVVFVILYGIAHLVGNLQQEKKKAARPQPVEPRPNDFGPAGPAQPAPAGNQPTLEESLRREVEEFLRKAQGGQPQQPKQQKPAPQRPRQPQRNEGQRQQPRPTRPQPQRSAEAAPPTRRLVEARSPESAAPITPLSESRPLAAQAPLGTGAALNTQAIVEHAKSLGATVAQADERMQQHLSQKFTHQLGALATATPTERRAAAIAGSMAKELQSMLANPNSVRQLIIAGEILRRPEERWQIEFPSFEGRGKGRD